MSLAYQIENKQIVLISVTKESYSKNLSEIIRKVNEFGNKICYVALNNPYNSILSTLESLSIDKSKFYFIDVLTRTVSIPPKIDICTFVESPNALDELNISFAKAMKEKGCDYALFDALTSLLIHNPSIQVLKLSQNIMTRLKVEGKNGVFIVIREDNEELIKDLTMFVDSVMTL